jgi:hypothetical protein
MTTLSLKTSAAPNFGSIKRLAEAFNYFIEVLAEAKQMARDAQQRFPFLVE